MVILKMYRTNNCVFIQCRLEWVGRTSPAQNWGGGSLSERISVHCKETKVHHQGQRPRTKHHHPMEEWSEGEKTFPQTSKLEVGDLN